MNILFLAPQPFFVERGTPIAVRLALEGLGKLGVIHEIRCITYSEGEDIPLAKVRHYRINRCSLLSNIRAGISLKKILADLLLFAHALYHYRALSKKGAVIVHAVEESVFFALLLKWVLGTRYIYDMDSNITGQLVDKWRFCRPLLPLLHWCERAAIRNAALVVAVCDALSEKATNCGAQAIVTLRDISLLEHYNAVPPCSLRSELGIDAATPLILYVGVIDIVLPSSTASATPRA